MTDVDMCGVDDDDISVTSTVPSEQESEYEVETILTERTQDDQPVYLVKWAGYPIERATWEPAESFFNDETFLDWKRKRKAIAEGKQPEFDLVSFENHLITLEDAREKRGRRREAKRRRLGLSREQTDARKKQRVDGAASPASSNYPSFTNSDSGTARMNPPSRPTAVRHIPPKPPMVLFGSGQNRHGPWMAARNKNRKPDDPDKQFSNLSTKWRFEKAKGYEPHPNINQLELIRPSDWPARTGAPVANPKVADHLVDSPIGGSPVASPVEKNNPFSDRYRPSSPAAGLRRQLTSDSWRSESSPPRAPRVPERQTSRDSWRPESPRTRRPPLPEGQGSRDSWRASSFHARDAFNPERPAPDSRRPEFTFSRDHPGTPDERNFSQLQIENDGARSQWLNEEPIPPLPPRRPMAIKGANFRRARDEYSQTRFWNHGEVFVNMYFGPEKRFIGPVRLCGLSPMSRSRVIQSKKDNTIDVWFQQICTLDEYRELCNRSKTNFRYDNGWIEGYDDTEPDVYRTGQALQRGNFLAIAYPDEPTWGKNVLLAYSSVSLDFDFLRNDFNFSPDTFLHLTVRNPLAYLDRPTPSNRIFRAIPAQMTKLQDNLPTPMEQRAEKDLLEAHIAQDLQLRLPADAGNHVETPALPQEEPMETDEPAPVQKICSAQQQLQQQQLSVANFDVDDYFSNVFKMTFDVLTTNNGVEKGRAQVFYLMCPPENTLAQDECGIIVEFLKKHEAVIFSNRLEEDWERFVRTINRGVVLFHDSFVNYDTMFSLRGLIHKPFTFWSFSLTGIGEGDNKTYFQRLFPHGGVILLTEDFMVREPDATVIILAWFYDWTKKRFPGSWKMMLRPNILEWLLKQPEPAEKQRQGVWLAMYSLIAKLSTTDNGTFLTHSEPLDGIHDDSPENRVISPPTIPLYGSRTEEDTKGLDTQEQRDTDHLAEFFAGWALVNSHRFRRFTIITTKPLKSWNLWNHVDVKETAMDFFKAYGVDYRTYWSQLKGKTSPKDKDKEKKQDGESPTKEKKQGADSPSKSDAAKMGSAQGPARL